MKRQVRVMLKEKKRLYKIINNRFNQANKPRLTFDCLCEMIFIEDQLRKWGVK